jgi:hypothetical protein
METCPTILIEIGRFVQGFSNKKRRFHPPKITSQDGQLTF